MPPRRAPSFPTTQILQLHAGEIKHAHCHFCLNLHAEEEKGSSIVIHAKRPGTKDGLGVSVQLMNMGAAGGAGEGNQPLFLPLKTGLLLLCQEKLS